MKVKHETMASRTWQSERNDPPLVVVDMGHGIVPHRSTG